MERIEDLLKRWETNREKMQQKDKEAKEKGVLKGRYIREPYADGYAFYEIIRENKNTVRIRVVKGIGDDWVIPYWGEETSIDKEYALQNLAQRDFFSELANRKKGGNNND